MDYLTITILNALSQATEGYFRGKAESSERQQKLADTQAKIEDEQRKWERNQEAKIKYVFINFETQKDEINPSKERLKDYFDENKEQFKVPPKVKIAYILVKGLNPELIKNIEKQMQKKKSLEVISNQFGLEITESSYFSINDPIEGLDGQEESRKEPTRQN